MTPYKLNRERKRRDEVKKSEGKGEEKKQSKGETKEIEEVHKHGNISII